MKLSPYTYINANLSDHGITAAKLVELVSSFAHAQGVTRVDLSDNPISGSKYKHGMKHHGVGRCSFFQQDFKSHSFEVRYGAQVDRDRGF